MVLKVLDGPIATVFLLYIPLWQFSALHPISMYSNQDLINLSNLDYLNLLALGTIIVILTNQK